MSTIIDKHLIQVTQGDTLNVALTLFDRLGKRYIPKEKDVIQFTLKKDYKSENILIKKRIPHDSLILSLTPAETYITPACYIYDIQIIYANGDRDTFISGGTFRVTPVLTTDVVPSREDLNIQNIDYGIVFSNYDGSIYRYYYADEFMKIDKLPEIPTRNGWTPIEWNWTLEDIKENLIDKNGNVINDRFINVGAVYKKLDNEFEISEFYLDIIDGDNNTTLSFSSIDNSIIQIKIDDEEWIDYVEPGTYYIPTGLHIVYVKCSEKYTSKRILSEKESYKLIKCKIGCNLLIDNITFSKYYRLQEIQISEGAEIIPNQCFYYNTNLRKVILPQSILKINRNAFSYCTLLTDINIPNNIDTISEECFLGDDLLKTLIIPSSVKTIDKNVFYESKSLNNVSLPSTIKNIGNGVFFKTYSLNNINLPNSIELIDMNAFGYSNLKTVYIPNNNSLQIKEAVFKDNYNLTSVYNYMCDIIPANCFANDYNLINFDFKYVKSINPGAFENCISLIPQNYDNLTFISSNAFNKCNSIENFIIPNTVTFLGSYVLASNYNLQNVKLPDDLTEIPAYAFYYDYSLCDVKIPDMVTTINTSAFYNCQSLRKVIFGRNIQTIKNNAFANSYINILDFSKCKQVPTLSNTNAFSGFTGKMLIPSSLYTVWSNSTNWIYYKQFMEAV